LICPPGYPSRHRTRQSPCPSKRTLIRKRGQFYTLDAAKKSTPFIVRLYDCSSRAWEFWATRLAVICCPDEAAQESGFLDRPAVVWDPDRTVCDHVDLANTVILPRRAHARRRRRRARCVALGQPVGTTLHAHDFTSRVRRVGRVGQPCIALDFTPGGLCHENAGLRSQNVCATQWPGSTAARWDRMSRNSRCLESTACLRLGAGCWVWVLYLAV